jgi:hypothetical protein
MENVQVAEGLEKKEALPIHRQSLLASLAISMKMVMRSWIQRSLWERFTPYTREVPAKGAHVVQGEKADELRQTIALNKREFSTLPILFYTQTHHTPRTGSASAGPVFLGRYSFKSN